MAIKSRLSKTVFICVVIVAIAISGCNKRNILINISNDSGATISDAKIDYSGGSYIVHKLEPGMTDARYIKPKGESHLELTFVDVEGRTIKKAIIDVYIGSGYSGSILITIGKDNKISWKDNTTIK